MEDFDQAAFDEYLDGDTSDLDPSEGQVRDYYPEDHGDLELHNALHPDGYHG